MSVAVSASEAGALASPDDTRVVKKDRRAMSADVGVSIRTFSELEAQGVIVPLERGRGGRGSVYDAVETLKRCLRHVRQEHPAGGERAARERRDLASAALSEQLHRRRAGELLEAGEVRHAWLSVVVAARSRLLALPRALADRCAHATTAAEVEQILRDEVHSALRELAATSVDTHRGGDLTDTTNPPASAPKRKGRKP